MIKYLSNVQLELHPSSLTEEPRRVFPTWASDPTRCRDLSGSVHGQWGWGGAAWELTEAWWRGRSGQGLHLLPGSPCFSCLETSAKEEAQPYRLPRQTPRPLTEACLCPLSILLTAPPFLTVFSIKLLLCYFCGGCC